MIIKKYSQQQNSETQTEEKAEKKPFSCTKFQESDFKNQSNSKH